MNSRVDLIWLGNAKDRPEWSLGEAWPTEPVPHAVHERVKRQLQTSKAEAWLFWDSTVNLPEPERLLEALARPGEVWHAGLRLGMAGLPGLIDFVAPTWMLNRDPDSQIEATSWRLSLKACLVRTDALRQLGGIRPEFKTLEGVSLEMGHRYVVRGAITRHIPWLLPEPPLSVNSVLSLEDELRFIYYRFGRSWTRWALVRALATGYASSRDILRAYRELRNEACPSEPPPLTRSERATVYDTGCASVSVLIPTLDRYPYLRTVLDQLRRQTVTPVEVLIVDQTAVERRDTALAEEFTDLPLKVMYLDRPGQCSSRNAGLQVAKGDYVLFIDDDDEIPPTLIEAHLRNRSCFSAEVSSGVADEVGAGSLPEMFTYTRASDVFPTNNTLICKDVLQRSGLFDLAYERGQRADGDLGMRVYLSGALMVLNPEISVLHHHAPSGGLRAHKARVITYSSSRRSLTERLLPSVTEIYLAMRYFTSSQVREALWLWIFGTFSVRGGLFRKALKFAISFLCLPDTLWETRKRRKQTAWLLREYPKIPALVDSDSAPALPLKSA